MPTDISRWPFLIKGINMDLYTFFAVVAVAAMAFAASAMHTYYKYGPGAEQSNRRISKKDKK